MQYNRLQQKGQTYEAAQNFSEPKKGKNDLQLISQRWVFGGLSLDLVCHFFFIHLVATTYYVLWVRPKTGK